MPRGEKSKYTSKQVRMAKHIENGYEHRGLPEKAAKQRAWATVNKQTGGAQKKSGTNKVSRGRKSKSSSPARKAA